MPIAELSTLPQSSLENLQILYKISCQQTGHTEAIHNHLKNLYTIKYWINAHPKNDARMQDHFYCAEALVHPDAVQILTRQK